MDISMLIDTIHFEKFCVAIHTHTQHTHTHTHTQTHTYTHILKLSKVHAPDPPLVFALHECVCFAHYDSAFSN